MVIREYSRRDHAGRWQPGTSPNPAGKPKGTRHRVTRAVEALLEGEAEGLTRKAVELALAGDTTALRLCLDRIAPPRKDRPVTFKLPPIGTINDVAAAISATLAAMSRGEITPSEAATVAGVLDVKRRALELIELEQRVAALEQRQQRKGAA
jgi:hypothetical protein